MPNDGDQVTFKSPTTGNVQPVPQEHWDEALKQGYQPVSHVVMYDPSGNRGMVPRNQMEGYTRQGYQTTPKTSFEANRPGKGITTEGAGAAALETAKQIPSGIASLFDPTRGLSGAGLQVLGMNPRSGTTSDRFSEVPIVNAVREAKAGWERGSDPRAKLGEAASSFLGSFAGMSGRSAAEHAARGEGGAILGEAAVPAGLAIGGPLVGEAVKPLRPALQRLSYKELPASGQPTLTPKARAMSMLGGAGVGALATGGHYVGGHAGLLLGPEFYKGLIGTPELGDIRNPGQFSKVPLKAPSGARTSVLGRGKSTLFAGEGMTSSSSPTYQGELPAAPAEAPAPFPQVLSKAEAVPQKPVPLYPEPRTALPGERPGAMWSVPREELPGAAQRGQPGAADVLGSLGRPVLFEPRGAIGSQPEFGAMRERVLGTSKPTQSPAAPPPSSIKSQARARLLEKSRAQSVPEWMTQEKSMDLERLRKLQREGTPEEQAYANRILRGEFGEQ